MTSPEDRVSALLHYFGWQGGTIHQIAAETGLDSATILYAEIPELGWRTGDGFSAIRTCSKAHRVQVLAPRHKGDWYFWGTAIRGYWATGRGLQHERA